MCVSIGFFQKEPVRVFNYFCLYEKVRRIVLLFALVFASLFIRPELKRIYLVNFVMKNYEKRVFFL